MENTNTGFWMYGPNGEAQIFVNKEDVPNGWKDTPASFTKTEAKDDGVANIKAANNTTEQEPVATVSAAASVETTPSDTSSKKKVK
jgi:hypothetical protein